tara:strand:+ start:179 stop:370 length:192 start_codon:yes stop_codon:yes gene_type:complete
MTTKVRKWLPTLVELIKRLSIHLQKEVYSIENKETYANEIKDIVSDIDLILKNNQNKISGQFI